MFLFITLVNYHTTCFSSPSLSFCNFFSIFLIFICQSAHCLHPKSGIKSVPAASFIYLPRHCHSLRHDDGNEIAPYSTGHTKKIPLLQ
ncbi:hypothetical protein BDB00DRAFT_164534 [Zychaea mexicana]|uniref:uncharacterized protein n=1 Tax=Zychaea mexicana TaxID=64656 RepID=UPI0022FE6C61|nr:uncharacterized protein BDB00DRAFT_164534 [Zychaea mexicana]KAI9496138.1 hypothetical protein BDB00DRAFT_164534 [Zychaea mexicana]